MAGCFKKYWLLLLPFCFCLSISSAQQVKKRNSIAFHSINQAGLLNGEAGSAFQVQTINGIQYRSWYAGIGAGIDYYRFRGIPLFADIRKAFGHTKNKFFIYGDAGIHFSWITDKEKNSLGPSAKLSNGLYLDGGIGYQAGIGNRNALLISVGYSYKQVKNETPAYYYYPLYTTMITYTPPPSNTTIDYQLSRVSIKLGWEF
ncbi:MAG TPA: hypothetical protein VHC50_12285 [Puia sp.]|nr:hypothetical protein [Puia sp.]